MGVKVKAEEVLSKVKEAINSDNIEILADNYLLSLLGNAVEKQIKMKPGKVIAVFGSAYECANCGNTLEINSLTGNYCNWCGQKLDWSDLK